MIRAFLEFLMLVAERLENFLWSLYDGAGYSGAPDDTRRPVSDRDAERRRPK